MKRTLDIIYTSDTHSHVFPVDYANGVPENSGILNIAAQVEKNGNTLILDGGDTLQGTPLSQFYLKHAKDYPYHPMAEAFNTLGCDYYTLGNHDFNFGYDALKSYLEAMNGTCLCANAIDLQGELKIEKRAIHVLDNGLRIGITGVVTDYVNIWEQPQNLINFSITDPFKAAKAAYESMKNYCDICICIYHGGFEEDLETGRLLSGSTENIGCRIARELDFDILLTGHQHMAVEGVDLYGTYSVQPPANAGHFIQIHAEEENGAVVYSSSLEKTLDHHETGTYEKLLPLENDTQNWLDQIVGRLAEEIEPEEKLSAAIHGSKVAAIFNQVQLEETGADFSCTSLGNVPVGLKTEVTMRNICGAYLFANTLVVMEVDQQVLKETLERCAAYFTLVNGEPQISDEFLKPKIEHYNYDFFAGLDYEFDLSKPVGSRVVKMNKLDGTPLGDQKYKLVTSNYRATGTGGYEALGESPVLWRGSTEMPELVAEYIKNNSPLPHIHNSKFSVK